MNFLLGFIAGWLVTCAVIGFLLCLFLVGDKRPDDDGMECAECGESMHPMLFPGHDCDNPGQQMAGVAAVNLPTDKDLGDMTNEVSDGQDLFCNCSNCAAVIERLIHGVKCEYCGEWYDNRTHQICPECG